MRGNVGFGSSRGDYFLSFFLITFFFTINVFLIIRLSVASFMSINTAKGSGSDCMNHHSTTQHRGLCPRLTSDLQGQGRHTLGVKWSTGSIVQTVSPSIYWLPKWSIMKWFTRSTTTPPGSSKAGGVACLLHSADVYTNEPSIWFIREWTEAGPHQL